MVFNDTFNFISVTSLGQFYCWRSPECPKKTTDLSKVKKVYELSLPMSAEKRIKANTPLDIQRLRVINVSKYFKLNIVSRECVVKYIII